MKLSALTPVAGLLIAACATLGAQSPAALWIDVPYVSQPRDGCGAASLSMIMQYWAAQPGGSKGPGSDVAAIQNKLYSPREHGIPAASMAAYLRLHGFEAVAFHANWSDLEQQLKKGRPLIVALRPQGQSQLHYVVIDGIDSGHELVTMNDPAERKLLTEERARFEKDWSATHNWALLAVPAAANSSNSPNFH